MGIAAAIIGSALLGAGASYYASEKQEKAQKKASQQAERNAERQARQAEQDANRARVNRPNADAALESAMQANQSGAGSTMLTGPGGVDPNQLNLGKNTLLGS